MKKKVIIIVLIVIGILLLTAIGTFVGVKYFTGKENKKLAQSVEGEKWVDRTIEDENYYYAISNDEIVKSRKDGVEQKLVYGTSNKVNERFIRQLTIAGENVYFCNIVKKDNVDYMQITKVKTDGTGKPEVLMEHKIGSYEQTVINFTSKNIYYVCENTLYNYDIENNKEEVWLKDVNENEKYPVHFSICEDGNIYCIKNSKLCKITKEKIETINSKESFDSSVAIVKKGDYIYMVPNSSTSDKMEYYNLKDSKKGEVEYGTKSEKVIYFHSGNTAFMSKGDKIYNINQDKWDEYCDSKDVITVTKNTKGTVSDIIKYQDVLCIRRVDNTDLYNFKQGFLYEKTNEALATRDTYALNKIESTGFREFKADTKAANITSTSCTAEEIQAKLTIGNIDSCTIESVYEQNGYIYFIVSNSEAGFELFRKNNSQPLELVKTIKEKYIRVKYDEDSCILETYFSIYKFDYNTQKITTLYTTDARMRALGKKDLSHYVAYLNKEVVVLDFGTGHIVKSAYDGSYVQVQAYDRSFDLEFADTTLLKNYEFKVEDGYFKFLKGKVNGDYTNASTVIKQLNLETGKMEEVK